jgi:hypothetical protein
MSYGLVICSELKNTSWSLPLPALASVPLNVFVAPLALSIVSSEFRIGRQQSNHNKRKE